MTKLICTAAPMLLAFSLTTFMPVAAHAQAAKTAAKYSPPRLADGRPDFSGFWSNHTATPLERPDQFQGREFLTPAEAVEIEARSVRVDQKKPPPGSVGGYNAIFFEGRRVNATLRTSMITDPKNGKLPPLTPEAQKKFAAERAYRDQHPADDAQHMFVWDRCLWMPNIGPPMMPYAYNNTYQIVQSHDHVAIAAEMMHDFRVIPVDGRPHGATTRWSGDSVGHYEGDTLVVETTNLNGKADWDDGVVDPAVNWAGRSAFLVPYHTGRKTHAIEKFTRTAPDVLLYQFTVEDPEIYTKPFSGEITMRPSSDPVYEYACHEGNYALPGILSGVRTEERASATGKTGQ